MGPRLEALSDALLAVTGATVPVFVNDQPQAMWTSFRVRGVTLSISELLPKECELTSPSPAE